VETFAKERRLGDFPLKKAAWETPSRFTYDFPWQSERTIGYSFPSHPVVPRLNI